MKEAVEGFLVAFGAVVLILFGLWIGLGIGNDHGYQRGISHCLSRPIPAECVAMDTVITVKPR